MGAQTVPYTLDSLTRYIESIEPYIAKKSNKFVGMEYSIDVQHGTKSILRMDEKAVTLSGGDLEFAHATEILDRSGVFPLQLEFMSGWTSDSGITIGRSKGDLLGWINELIPKLKEPPKFVPDTNFLRRCYFSNHFRSLVSQLEPHQSLFKLSRLTILEVESLYNRAKKAIRSKNESLLKPEVKEEDRKRIKHALQNDERDVRLAFYAIKEILALKELGARELPALEQSLLQSFIEQSEGYGDAWIRQELHAADAYYGRGNNRGQIFMTCDLMNALAAVAEGIHAIYVSRIMEQGAKVFPCNAAVQQALIISNTAIQFGECDCTIRIGSETERFKIVGMWGGKTMKDWLNDVFLRKDEGPRLLS